MGVIRKEKAAAPGSCSLELFVTMKGKPKEVLQERDMLVTGHKPAKGKRARMFTLRGGQK